MVDEEIPATDPWVTAKVIGPLLDGVFPLRGKIPVLKKWYNHARQSEDGIKKYAQEWKGYNYGVYLETAFVLDCDVQGSDALKLELTKLKELLGSFEPGFTVVTGKGRYHIYCDAKEREIHSQKLTDSTHIKGWHGYVVGPGSWHPETSLQYTICEYDAHNDPRKLTDLPAETLDRLAAKRVRYDTLDEKRVITFNLGNSADVLDLEHPPCIRKLMLRGAPADQDYVQANHTIARYVISAGLTDSDGAVIAEKMAINTLPDHPTSKDAHDKIYNFRSCLSSARNNPEKNQFACSYVRGSEELIAVDLCKGCSKLEPSSNSGPDIDAIVRAEALRILRQEDPMEYLVAQYTSRHTSDVEIGKLGFLQKAGQNVLNSSGIQKGAFAGSGKGKSSSDYTLLHHYPPELVLNAAFSNKALYRIPLRPGMVICLDDALLTDEFEVVVRRSMSNFQGDTVYITLDNKNEPLELIIPPRIIWMINDVNSSLDIQTENRMVGVSNDESEAADNATFELQAARFEQGAPDYPVTFETKVCRDMFRVLLDEIGEFYVAIPWASKIIWEGLKGNRRNFPIFCDFIMAFAALRCMQRKTIGGHVIATRQDFDDAKELYTKLGTSQTTKLNSREQRIIQAIMAHGRSATIKDILPYVNKEAPEQYAPMAAHDVRRILQGRDGKGGLLSKIPELSAEMRTVSTSLSSGSKESGYTSESSSVRAMVYELSPDYQYLATFDSGRISLPDGVDIVEDVMALPLYQPRAANSSLEWSSDNTDAQASDESNKGLIDDYKRRLKTAIPRLPQKNMQAPGCSHPSQPTDEQAGACEIEGAHLNRGNAANTSISHIDELHTDKKKQKTDQNNDGSSYHKNGEQGGNLDNQITAIDHGVLRPAFSGAAFAHTDEEFLEFFSHELILFKLFGERDDNGVKFATDDDIYREITGRVSDARHIHREDVAQAGERLRYHPAIVRELDEIFKRTPRGKADTPKLME
ncbi:MAG: bifunctional DNA primase/polymerase [Halobacteriota archaeon]